LPGEKSGHSVIRWYCQTEALSLIFFGWRGWWSPDCLTSVENLGEKGQEQGSARKHEHDDHGDHLRDVAKVTLDFFYFFPGPLLPGVAILHEQLHESLHRQHLTEEKCFVLHQEAFEVSNDDELLPSGRGHFTP